MEQMNRKIVTGFIVAVMAQSANAQVYCDESPAGIKKRFNAADVVVIAHVKSTKTISMVEDDVGRKVPTELSQIEVKQTFKGKSSERMDVHAFALISEHPSLIEGVSYLFFLPNSGELTNCNNIIMSKTKETRALLMEIRNFSQSRREK